MQVYYGCLENKFLKIQIKQFLNQRYIPVPGAWIPKIFKLIRNRINRNSELYVSMNVVPFLTPRSCPNVNISLMNLKNRILKKKNCLTFWIELQKTDFDPCLEHFQKVELGKYLAFKTEERKGSLPETTIQAEWRTKLLLTVWIFRIPSPPSFLGLHISSQDLKAIGLVPSFSSLRRSGS